MTAAVPAGRPAARPGTTRLLVVGGGITGLAAAWEGVQRGAQVTVVEASGAVGGKVVTERVNGLLVEHGPDAFVAYRPAALALIAELGLSDEVISVSGNRSVFLRARGRLHPLPAGMGMVLPTRVGPFLTTRILSVPDKLRAGLDLVLPRRLGPGDVAIGAFLRARLGDGIVERFADPMIGGIYGAGVDDLSLDAVLPSLRDNERSHRSLMLASLAQGRAARNGATTRGPASSPFRSLRAGLGSLPVALATALGEAAAVVRTGVTVRSLEYTDGVTTARLSDGTTVTADVVILSGGVASSAGLLAEDFPAAARALRDIPLASTALVTLAYRSKAFATPPTTHGWLEADPAPVSGVTVSSAKWEGRAPSDQVLLRAFVPDRVGPLNREPDEVVIDAVAAHVAPILGIREQPVLARVTRWPEVMPKYTVGHLDRVAAVDRALAARPSWQVAGSALHGVGVPDCIADGRRAAAAVLVGKVAP